MVAIAVKIAKLLAGTLLVIAAGSVLVRLVRPPVTSAGSNSPTPSPSIVVDSPSPSPSVVPACAQPTLIGTVDQARVSARKSADPKAKVVASFGRINADGAPQVFDLQAATAGSDGKRWYRALLPVRPNGTTGYLPATALRVTNTQYRIRVDRPHLNLTLFKGCDQVKRFPIGLGKESTPTPDGRYYIIALLKPPIRNSVYGEYAYGLSAFSDVLKNWTGGGIIGIHGTNDPSSIGDRKSHGCIRMYNKDIRQLVPILPLGTPVDIV
ncbi:MAG: L,D-transpeptidase [Actinobacteria bacterium]|nr:MAG: L,D-transpeptidase [Actinomycetota bacterium]